MSVYGLNYIPRFWSSDYSLLALKYQPSVQDTIYKNKIQMQIQPFPRESTFNL